MTVGSGTRLKLQELDLALERDQAALTACPRLLRRIKSARLTSSSGY